MTKTDNDDKSRSLPDDATRPHKPIDKASPRQGHMGAEEDVTKQSKPATQELAEMTSKHGQASSPQDDDYSPADEITSG